MSIRAGGLVALVVAVGFLLGIAACQRTGTPTNSAPDAPADGWFEDVTDAVGLPREAPGLGVAVADVNNDGWPDLFICSGTFNALFLNDGKGQLKEMPGSRQLFAYQGAGEGGHDEVDGG